MCPSRGLSPHVALCGWLGSKHQWTNHEPGHEIQSEVGHSTGRHEVSQSELGHSGSRVQRREWIAFFCCFFFWCMFQPRFRFRDLPWSSSARRTPSELKVCQISLSISWLIVTSLVRLVFFDWTSWTRAITENRWGLNFLLERVR